MKTILLFVAIISCLLIGLILSNYYQKRRLFFTDLYLFSKNLKLYISYSQEKILNIIEKNKNKYNKSFCLFLDNYQDYLKGNRDKNKIIENRLSFLYSEEKNALINFFCDIGSMSQYEELEKIDFNILQFLQFKEKSENDFKKYSFLYLKLFIVFAVMLLIIFL